MAEPLCLLSVHAHPDDEASKGAGTVARYHAEGVRTVLVCCTGGEAGDILNPAMDRPEVRERPARGADGGARPARPRSSATTRSCMLGYRDSGMPDTRGQRATPTASPTPPSTRPSAGWSRSSAASGPQVIVTYGDDQEGYPHPDHLRVHDISHARVRRGRRSRLRTPSWASRGSRRSSTTRSGRGPGCVAMHEKFARARPRVAVRRATGSSGPSQDDRITTQVDVAGYVRRPRARRCWPTPPRSIPTSPFWFGLPDEVARDGPPVRRLHAGPEPGADRAARGRPLRRRALISSPRERRHGCTP